ncbi:MAG: efflux RND transporter periplasmic adaptor subunit [Candidatus Glassbacteria bacterium]|nr:efflux RND transporter periplasmic adaptor subunit [Candidatus Glassbacteria bacterium]
MNSRLLRKAGIPVAILAGAFALTAIMIASRSAPEKQHRVSPGPLVETIEVSPTSHQVTVYATGTVQPRVEANIAPQVEGKVVKVADQFVAGGYFSAGEVMFEIEDVDYVLALQGAESQLARAEYELATAEGRAEVARDEWERLGDRRSGEPNPLVLHEPQLKNARAQLKAAAATVERAELNLERTKVHAPFNCRVRSENIDPGQYVRSGTTVAVLIGTDRAEVTVPLPLSDLRWLDVPSPVNSLAGSPAEVRMEVDGRIYSWIGRVVRNLGVVDQQGRMERVVIAVDDPYGLGDPESGRPFELAVGSFVEVRISGRMLDNVYRLPASALRQNRTVWLFVAADSTLKIGNVELLRREQETAVLGSGLRAGDRVVTTYLAGAADGLKLRVAQTGEVR